MVAVRDSSVVCPCWSGPRGSSTYAVAFTAPVTPPAIDRPSAVPLFGAAHKVKEVLQTDWLGTANWELLFVGLLLLIPLYFLVRCVGRGRPAWRDRALPAREQLLPGGGSWPRW